MLMDSRNEFCDATSLNTGAAGTYLIGNQIDQGAGVLVGDPADLFFVLTVDTSVDSTSDTTTVAFSLASDDSASISTSTSTVHFTTPVFTQAQLVAGFQYACKLPYGQTYERYLGVLQTTAVEAVTAGKVNAFLTKKVPSSKVLMSFPDAI